MSAGQCQIITEDNPQVPWASYEELNTTGGVTRLLLANRSHWLRNYKVGDLVGIKSKCCGHNHNVYFFCRGNVNVSMKVWIQLEQFSCKILLIFTTRRRCYIPEHCLDTRGSRCDAVWSQ